MVTPSEDKRASDPLRPTETAGSGQLTSPALSAFDERARLVHEALVGQNRELAAKRYQELQELVRTQVPVSRLDLQYQRAIVEALGASLGVRIDRELVLPPNSSVASTPNSSFQWQRMHAPDLDHPARIIASKFHQHCRDTYADSGVVIYRGRVVDTEVGASPGTRQDVFYAPWAPAQSNMASSTKSIGALATFCFLGDAKQLSLLDAPIVEYLDWPVWKSHPHAAKITLRHLMTHTSGLPGNGAFKQFKLDGDNQFGGHEDLHEAIRRIDLVKGHETPLQPPGMIVDYSNPGSQAVATVLSELVRRAGYQSLESFVTSRIIKRLGMERTTLDIFTPGEPCFYGGIHSTALDFARVGLMLMQRGTWQGAQFLSPEALREMLRSPINKIPKASPGISHLWWLKSEFNEQQLAYSCFCSLGYRNSSMHVFPALDLIFVRTRGFNHPVGIQAQTPDNVGADLSDIPVVLANTYGNALRAKHQEGL
jgi:CubicO group peptidase (beta-lactamase class C family)